MNRIWTTIAVAVLAVAFAGTALTAQPAPYKCYQIVVQDSATIGGDLIFGTSTIKIWVATDTLKFMDEVTGTKTLAELATVFATFLSLTDTPSGYAGGADKFLRVNDTPDGVVFDVIEEADITDLDKYSQAAVDSLLGYKADKVATPTVGNFAGLDGAGNITDSGSKSSDYEPADAAIMKEGENVSLLTNDASYQDDAEVAAAVTYENLYVNSDVGAASDQVSQGDHLHTGVYEPADATIMKEGENVSLLTNDSVYQSDTEVDATVATHTAIADAHHSRYLDSEAVSAMGVKGDSNPLNHDKYTDGEAAAQVTFENLDSSGDVGTASTQVSFGNHLHSGVYEPADSTLMKEGENVSLLTNDANYQDDTDVSSSISTHASDSSAHHVRYADSEAVTAMGVKANSNPLNHDRFATSEVSANTDVIANTSARHTQNTDTSLDLGGANPVTAATLKGHVDDTSTNPHSVTATQVGNGTAQWNADKIQGVDVDDAAIADDKILKYDSGSGDLLYVTDEEGDLDTTLGLGNTATDKDLILKESGGTNTILATDKSAKTVTIGSGAQNYDVELHGNLNLHSDITGIVKLSSASGAVLEYATNPLGIGVGGWLSDGGLGIGAHDNGNDYPAAYLISTNIGTPAAGLAMFTDGGAGPFGQFLMTGATGSEEVACQVGSDGDADGSLSVEVKAGGKVLEVSPSDNVTIGSGYKIRLGDSNVTVARNGNDIEFTDVTNGTKTLTQLLPAATPGIDPVLGAGSASVGKNLSMSTGGGDEILGVDVSTPEILIGADAATNFVLNGVLRLATDTYINFPSSFSGTPDDLSLFWDGSDLKYRVSGASTINLTTPAVSLDDVLGVGTTATNKNMRVEDASNNLALLVTAASRQVDVHYLDVQGGVTTSLNPSVTNNKDLGTAGLRWLWVYGNVLNLTGLAEADEFRDKDDATTYLGSSQLSVGGNTIGKDGSNRFDMSAAVNMNSNKIAQVATGTVWSDAVHKKQMDDAITTAVAAVSFDLQDVLDADGTATDTTMILTDSGGNVSLKVDTTAKLTTVWDFDLDGDVTSDVIPKTSGLDVGGSSDQWDHGYFNVVHSLSGSGAKLENGNLTIGSVVLDSSGGDLKTNAVTATGTVTAEGGVITDMAAKGTCDASNRGRIVLEQAGSGSTDTLYICGKLASDAYGWGTVTVTF